MCLQSFKKFHVTDVFEEVILYDDNVVFRESEKYYINCSFGETKAILDQQIPFDPFTEDDWKINEINGNLTVHRVSDDCCVLGKNLIRCNRMFFQNEMQCVQGAGDFIGSLIALTLNTQQEWFKLLKTFTLPVNHHKVLNVNHISELFTDEFSAEAYISGLLTSAGHMLTRVIPQLDICVEKSANKRYGWDIYTYSLRKGVLSIYNLGDARVLDFENNLINNEQSKSNS